MAQGAAAGAEDRDAAGISERHWKSRVIPAKPSAQITAGDGLSDGDGVQDGKESLCGTDPMNPDTDGDGIPDNLDIIGDGLVLVTVTNQLPGYSAQVSAGTGNPEYKATVTFVPVLPSNTVRIVNAVVDGWIDDSFKINGVKYGWTWGIKPFHKNITGALPNPTNGIFDIELYDHVDPGWFGNGVSISGTCVMDCLVPVKVELKVTHPQNPGPTGSAAKYNSTPNEGSADNLFSIWPNEQLQVKVKTEPEELANNLPAGFITWTVNGFTIPDNKTEYTFTWGSPGIKEITVEIPSCGIIKKIRVDIPNVGIYSENYALFNLVSGAAALLIVDYGVEARDYCNTNYPVGAQRDAIRHAMWNALCVSSWLVSATEIDIVTTGHEHDNRDDDHEQAFNSTMDLKNNDVGQSVIHSTSLGNPDRLAIRTDLDIRYSVGIMWIWAGGGAQENSEGILIKSDGIKIYPTN